MPNVALLILLRAKAAATDEEKWWGAPWTAQSKHNLMQYALNSLRVDEIKDKIMQLFF